MQYHIISHHTISLILSYHTYHTYLLSSYHPIILSYTIILARVTHFFLHIMSYHTIPYHTYYHTGTIYTYYHPIIISSYHHDHTRTSDYFFILFFAHFYFPASGQAVITGVIPSPPRFLPSFLIAHRVQQSHCSSILYRVSLAHALAFSASQFVRKKKSPRIYTSMHSGGFDLTKLTYTLYLTDKHMSGDLFRAA